jgi:hypothetical protein
MAIDETAAAQELETTAAKEGEDAEAEAAKAKFALASSSTASAGFFNLSFLHAQAVSFNSIMGHVHVKLALDTGVHHQWRNFFRVFIRKYALLDHLDDTVPPEPAPAWSLLDATVVSWIYGSVSLGLLDTIHRAHYRHHCRGPSEACHGPNLCRGGTAAANAGPPATGARLRTLVEISNAIFLIV